VFFSHTFSGAYVFLCGEHHALGANVTIEILKRVLEDGDIVIHYCADRQPTTLYLQLDNTSKQNKNRYVFAFLAWLVVLGLLTDVLVSFLPVGHTHEDIDQMFSRFNSYLRHHDAHSRPELFSALQSAYHSSHGLSVKVEYLDRWTNFSGWVHDYLNKNAFAQISAYYQFRFVVVP
jgi:hypothetical protein